VSTQRGSIRKRFGSTQAVKAGEIPNTELTSMFPCNIAGVQYMLVSNGKELWSVKGTDGGVNKIGEGFTANTRWSFVQAPKTTGVENEGPVYMVNGKDKPQFWSGAEAKTTVAEWKGVASAAKLTNGVLPLNSFILQSATAKFIPGDEGLNVKFEEEVLVSGLKQEFALIETVISPTEVRLAIPEPGWEKAYSGKHFTIERSFYEKGEHVPNGQHMVFHGNRIWMTGIEADSAAVWFSELVSIGEGGSQADPSSWPATNVVRFEASDGNEITGIGVVGPYILVFKENKTWAIHDINTGANRQLSDKVGCIAQRSIVESGQGTYFLTADQGVYLTNGSSLTEMSYNVRPTILAINPKNRQKAAGAYYNNHYYLSFPSGETETPNRTLDYDVQLKSWWLHDLSGYQWQLWEPKTGESALYGLVTGKQLGFVKSFVTGLYTDRGTNYTGNGSLGAFWISPWEPFAYYIFRHRIEAPFLKKRVRQIFFNGEGQIQVEAFKDFSIGGRIEKGVVGANEIATSAVTPVNFGAASEVWAEDPKGTKAKWAEEVEGTEKLWGGETTVGQARIYSPGVGFVWAVGFGNNSAEGFIVNAYTYMLQFRKS
jgi:hypothetical protein